MHQIHVFTGKLSTCLVSVNFDYLWFFDWSVIESEGQEIVFHHLIAKKKIGKKIGWVLRVLIQNKREGPYTTCPT